MVFFIRTHKVLCVIMAVLAVFTIVSYIGNRWWWY
jgi:hypothetical protein